MTHLILHIGWPKTGTTTLQAFCAQNPAWLQAQGLSYFRSRGDSIGDISRLLERGEDPQPAAARLADFAAGQGGRAVIASSEGLATNDLAGISALLSAASWRDITVVAYLRAQEAYLEGIYKQARKWGNPMPLAQCLAGPLLHSAEYHRYVSAWQEWCDARGARLILRLYTPQDLVQGDIRADFFTALGFDALENLPASTNVSPSAALLQLYERLPPIPRLQQINREMVASGMAGVTGSGDVLTAAQSQALRARFAAGNAQLCARYFPGRRELFPIQKNALAAEVDLPAIRAHLIHVIRRLRGDHLADQAAAALAKDAH